MKCSELLVERPKSNSFRDKRILLKLIHYSKQSTNNFVIRPNGRVTISSDQNGHISHGNGRVYFWMVEGITQNISGSIGVFTHTQKMKKRWRCLMTLLFFSIVYNKWR